MRVSTFFFLIRRGVRNLGKHWAMTAACIASLCVCMVLNTFASLLEVNVDNMVEYLGNQNEMVVYIDPDADDATIQNIGEKLSAMNGITGVNYVSKRDALEKYRGYMDEYASLWDELENDNPLKANYSVSVADLGQMESISTRIRAIPGVNKVKAPLELSETFVQIQTAVNKAGRLVVVVLMVVSVITVGNTIRLSVFARRREIEIMKYVGATNLQVVLPFVAEGLLIGLIAGGLASLGTIAGYGYLVESTGTMGGLWQLFMAQGLIPVANVWPTILTYSLAGGALVGGLGSLFSIRKHLNV